ncbi:MAG TPA: type II secretion system protein GspM [Kofleriaceae bacterium]
MSAISERAREFWDRISPRERGLVIVLGIAAPIVIVIWLGMQIGDGLGNMQTRNDEMRRALVVLTSLRGRGPIQASDDLVAGMPVEPLSLDTYLTNAAQAAGFTLKGTTPRTPVVRNGFVTNSVSLQVTDVSIDQLEKFLQSVETKSRYVAVTRLDVSRHDYKGKDKLEAQLEVSTYAKEPPKKGEGSGSGSDAGSADKGS